MLRKRANAYLYKGNYERAIQDYTLAIDLSPKDPNLFNYRGFAYLKQSDSVHAFLDFDHVISLNPKHPVGFVSRGVARFYMGQLAAAKADFAAAIELNPPFAQAGLWSYLINSRIGQTANARRDLAKYSERIRLTTWPGQVVDFYLGRRSSDSLLSVLKPSELWKDKVQRCQAYFYLGENAMIAGNNEEAKRLFNLAVDTGVSLAYEYIGAQAELKRLQRREGQQSRP